MYKKIFALIIALIFLKEAIAAKGIGIAPLENNITLNPGEEYIIYLLVFNPSDTDAKVSFQAYCTNCLRDFRFLGLEGKINLTQKFVEVPSEIEIEKNTSFSEGKFVEIRLKVPYFVEEQLILGNKSFPWLGLSSSFEELNFKIVASTGEITKISLISKVNVKIKDNTFWIVIFISIAFLLFVYLLRKKLRFFR